MQLQFPRGMSAADVHARINGLEDLEEDEQKQVLAAAKTNWYARPKATLKYKSYVSKKKKEEAVVAVAKQTQTKLDAFFPTLQKQ